MKIDTVLIAQPKTLEDVRKGLDYELHTVAHGPMITQQCENDDWILNPIDMDDSTIPEEGQQRAAKLFFSGLRIVGFIIAHEKDETLLEKPLELELERESESDEESGVDWGMVSEFLLFITGIMFVVMIAGAFSSPAPASSWASHHDRTKDPGRYYDPVLIAVLEEDNTWVEVFRWYE